MQNIKNKKNNKTTCPLHGPRQDMNSFKVIHAQWNPMNGTYYSDHVGGGHIKLTRANKYLADGEDLNMLFPWLWPRL